jgi:hypothetical protein
MIEMVLRAFGLVMLAGGALTAAVAASEYGRASDMPGALGAQLALRFRIDLTDAALLLGGGLLCLGVGSVLGALIPKAEVPADPYDAHPAKARESTEDLDFPDLHAE